MPGRPDFSTPGTSGSGQTVAVSQRPEIKSVEIENTTTVGKNGFEQDLIYAPAGSIYRVLSMEVKVFGDQGTSTGYHQVAIRPINAQKALSGRSDGDKSLILRGNEWQTATREQVPSNENTGNVVNSLTATGNSPLVIAYLTSGLDAQFENKRSYTLVVEEQSF